MPSVRCDGPAAFQRVWINVAVVRFEATQRRCVLFRVYLGSPKPPLECEGIYQDIVTQDSPSEKRFSEIRDGSLQLWEGGRSVTCQIPMHERRLCNCPTWRTGRSTQTDGPFGGQSRLSSASKRWNNRGFTRPTQTLCQPQSAHPFQRLCISRTPDSKSESVSVLPVTVESLGTVEVASNNLGPPWLHGVLECIPKNVGAPDVRVGFVFHL